MSSTEEYIGMRPLSLTLNRHTMTYQDIIILARKILIGIVLAVVPFLIFFLGLKFIQHI